MWLQGSTDAEMSRTGECQATDGWAVGQCRKGVFPNFVLQNPSLCLFIESTFDLLLVYTSDEANHFLRSNINVLIKYFFY